jgi:metal-sulfur cluster biosynthetic enzyme
VSDRDESEAFERRVWAELRTAFDPEIPVNIVDLGLVYGVRLVRRDDGRRSIDVDLTLTAPGCSMGELLKCQIEAKLRALPGVASATVRLVFDPPWERARMSDAARLQLGLELGEPPPAPAARPRLTVVGDGAPSASFPITPRRH